MARPIESLIEELPETLKTALVVRTDQSRNEKVDITSNRPRDLFKGATGSLVFQNVEGGFKLVFGQELLFNSGSARIREKARPVLARIARFMRITNYRIYIDGFTDNIPIHTELYPSNKALSLARAFAVMNYFVREEKLPSQTIALAGYGASHPVASNGTESGRAENRRVEIIFKNQKYF